MSTAQAGPAGEPDPSMEEILASIRRILAEDAPPPADAGHAPAPDRAHVPPPGAEDPGTPADEVLDLDPAMLVGEADHAPSAHATAETPPAEPPPVEAPAHATVEQASAEPPLDLLPDEPSPRAPVHAIEAEQPIMDPQPHHEAPSSPAAPPPTAPLAAEPPHAAAPAAGDHGGLVDPSAAAAAASSVGSLMRTLAAERSAAAWRGGPTLEDLVRDEMRPLLKSWLDTHLPPLVERLVRAEIERVVGRSEL